MWCRACNCEMENIPSMGCCCDDKNIMDFFKCTNPDCSNVGLVRSIKIPKRF